MNEKLKSAGASYLRAALASVLALWLSGVSDPKVLMNGLLAGLLSPVLHALNPNDASYGIVKK